MASKALKIAPVNEEFAAKITGVNLAQPLDPDIFLTIKNALHQYGVIFFPNQELEPANLSSFTKNFGTPDIHHLAEHTFPKYPEVRVLSNAKKNGKLVGTFNGGHYWHSDLSFLPETGYVTILYGIDCPPVGADTLFADMRAVHDALPKKTLAKLNGQQAVHDRNYRYSELYPERPPLTPEQIAHVPPANHPAIRTHPDTGRKSVFLVKEMVSKIGDLDETASRALLEEIEAFMESGNFTYCHKWQVRDLVIWDNRCTLHTATPYDTAKYSRTLYRTQVKGDAPFYTA
ncbi:MAG: taurine dioxygenase [Rhodospirillaceae bacterium]|nr:taurine dioxygenase [Rhodospirillaceae bacterium]|tara:strand:- start:3512 stop:4375 length:864 start_codon:yes stop_codon:yes gene_type:complete